MPTITPWRPHSQAIQVLGYLSQRQALCSPFGNGGHNGRGDGNGISGSPRPLDALLPARIAELCAARLRGLKRSFGPLADGLALMLGDGRQDVNGELVRLGHIDGDEIDAGLHKPGDEMHVAGEPVELGDHQRGTTGPAQDKSGGELRPVGVILAALDFLELAEQGSALYETGHGAALRL